MPRTTELQKGIDLLEYLYRTMRWTYRVERLDDGFNVQVFGPCAGDASAADLHEAAWMAVRAAKGEANGAAAT